MPDEHDPRLSNNPDKVELPKATDELSDDELSKISGGGIKVPDAPAKIIEIDV